MKKIVLVVLCHFFFTLSCLQAEEILHFGIFPNTNAKTAVRVFAPIAAILERDLGIPVVLVSAPDRKTFEERTLEGQYDIAWTCNACYFNARDNGILTAVARGIPSFRGLVLVRKDSAIETIEDLRHKTVGAVGEHSVAGFLFLRNMLADIGIHAPEDIAFTFIEPPESLPFKVFKKRVDACAYSEATYQRSQLFNTIRKDLKIIATSISIPQFPFAVKKTISPETAGQIGKILTGIKDEQILGRLKITGIIEASDKDYDDFNTLYTKIKNYSAHEKK